MYNLAMRIRFLIFFLLLGGAFLGVATFAEHLGLDNDPGWGRGRVVLSLMGILIGGLGAIQYYFTHEIAHLFTILRTLLSEVRVDFLQFIRHYWYTFPFTLVVIVVYIWFASSGSWTHWKPATRYYADLAIAFEHKQLYLITKPSPELLSLSNPYDPELRKGIRFPIDYSLYRGRYYIYWGAIPSLILVLLNLFLAGKVGDLFLAFGFICGIFILQVLFLLTFWDRFFRTSPKWLLILSIFISGLSGPWTYMLVNEPNGRIYESAISGSQFFFLGGLLVASRALVKSNLSYPAIVFTGFLWALSIGTRLIIAIPVGIACLIMAYQTWISYRLSIKNFILKMLALGLPLVACLFCIGWYNWARFGTVTDTGLQYSLAGQDMMKHQDVLFSYKYVTQNLYNYLINPPVFQSHFPYLYSDWGDKEILTSVYSLPEAYSANTITGLLYLAPFSSFAIISLFNSKIRQSSKINDNLLPSQSLINRLLFGTFAVAFCSLLFYFWSAVRYLGDFMPELMLLNIFAFWRGHELLLDNPGKQKAHSILGIALAITGIVVSILISLSANQYTLH